MADTGTEIACAYVSLIAKMPGIQRDIEGQLGAAGEAAGKRTGASFMGAFKPLAGLAAAAFASRAAKDFFSSAVSGASDLGEVQSKVNQIFGEQGARALQAFAAKGATALGQTSLEVQNAAATFGVFGKMAGLAGTDLTRFATDFVSLSTDLASFHNANPSEVVEALGAALRGETEPMRRFGVLLDDASMRNQALKMGLIATTKEALTPQQKVLAAQALIMEQTKDAHGDFAKTSAGLANQQRILAAQWTEMKTTLGGALLPVVTQVVTALNTAMKPVIGWLAETGVPKFSASITQITNAAAGLFAWFQTGRPTDLATALGLGGDSPIVQRLVAIRQGVADLFASLGPAIGPLAVGLGALVVKLPGVSGLLGTLLGQVPGLAGGFGALTKLVPMLGGPIGLLVGAFAALVAASPSLQSALGGLVSGVFSALGQLVTTLVPIFSQLASLLVGQLAPLLTMVASLLAGTLATAVEGLTPVISGIVSALGKLISTLLPPLLALVMRLASTMIPVIMQLVSVVMQVVNLLIATLVPVITRFVSALLPTMMQLIGAVVPIITQIIATIASLVSLVIANLIPVIASLMPVVETVLGVITGLIGAGMRVIQGVIQTVTGIISGDWSKVWDGIRNIFGGVWEEIKTIVTGAVNIMKAILSAAWSLIITSVTNTWNQIVGCVQAAWNGITWMVRTSIDNVIGFVGGLPGRILAAVGNLSNLLWGAGQDVVNGMIHGIESMLTNLAQTAANMAKHALDAAKNLLGIKSPSRAFAYLGNMSVAGLEDSLVAGRSRISRAGRELANAALSAPPTLGFLAGVGAGPRSGIHVEQHISSPHPQEAAALSAQWLGQALVGVRP